MIQGVYDALLRRYPNTTPAQIAYLQHLTEDATKRKRAEELIKNYLPVSPSIELWNFYVAYAYEFAVKKIGHHHGSGPMWAEYLHILNGEGMDGQNTEVLRSTYHRCLQIPLENLESLWSRYEAFEMGLNKITAQKFMSNLLPAHMRARAVLRQLSIYLNGLTMNNQLGIFLPAPATFSWQERQLIARWKAYLKWEEGNPLAIEGKDSALLYSRIQMVYRKAVIDMRYYPDIWFMAYFWTTSVGRKDEGDGQSSRLGWKPIPTGTYLATADPAKKDHRDFTEIHAVYERFFSVLRVELGRLSAAAEREKDQEELPKLKKQYSNAWINYMRFARRAEGQKACRDVFRTARKDEYIGWEVYEAAAMVEYRCNLEDGRQVAGRIFEMAVKKYRSDASVKQHIRLWRLWRLGQDAKDAKDRFFPKTHVFGKPSPFVLDKMSVLGKTSKTLLTDDARALFESVIGTFAPQEAKPIWEHWARSRYQCDDLEALLELERRMAELYPSGAPSSPSQHSREPDHPPPAPLLEKEGKPIQLPHAPAFICVATSSL
ncbi:hypothetical protein C8F04DRAFT_1284899 [Mycena alexandri]|uniref:mRNA 3'-end-processing protein RNA14 n=1 Tax=Mycena alexandri TaxID=1745969 RepID=A0AAD6RV52_9AGAR|nr:hypothetical protein C8F04DRAFT_1284899 [Mycena alexandri]